jgi:Family of unknown function (DUF5331)
VNTEQLRQSLKAKWLTYYRENRLWLTRLGVWVDSDGQRRPSSSFILATLSVLEPQLTQLLPLIVDLSSSPDRIVRALGLDINPDQAIEKFEAEDHDLTESPRLLPSGKSDAVTLPYASKTTHPIAHPSANPIANPIAKPTKSYADADESCRGSGSDSASELREW